MSARRRPDGTTRDAIEEGFRQVMGEWRAAETGPPRAEFSDPVLAALQGVSLSKLLDSEFDRHYTPSPNGATRMLKRVFAKLRGSNEA